MVLPIYTSLFFIVIFLLFFFWSLLDGDFGMRTLSIFSFSNISVNSLSGKCFWCNYLRGDSGFPWTACSQPYEHEDFCWHRFASFYQVAYHITLTTSIITHMSVSWPLKLIYVYDFFFSIGLLRVHHIGEGKVFQSQYLKAFQMHQTLFIESLCTCIP